MVACSMPCAKFIMASAISLITTIFAIILLILDRFQNTALTAFATSIISSNITYWTDAPKYKVDNQNL